MRIIHLIASALALACALAGPARAQSNVMQDTNPTLPIFTYGYVPTVHEWAKFAEEKQDLIASTNAASVLSTLGIGAVQSGYAPSIGLGSAANLTVANAAANLLITLQGGLTETLAQRVARTVQLDSYKQSSDPDDCLAFHRAYAALSLTPAVGEIGLPARHMQLGSSAHPCQIIIGLGAVNFHGQGWSENEGGTVSTTTGTWIELGDATQSPFLINATSASGTNFENIAFSQESAQATPAAGWTPAVFPYVVDIENAGGKVGFHNIMWFAIYDAIKAFNVGRVEIAWNYGHVFNNYIYFDSDYDVNRVDQVHLWPYWTFSPYVWAWTEANMDGIYTLRNDTPIFTNIFCIMCRSTIRFGGSSYGDTTRFTADNIHGDGTKYALWIDSTANGVAGSISAIDGQHVDNSADALLGGVNVIAGSATIQIDGANSSLQMGRGRSQYAAKSPVNITTAGQYLRIADLHADLWGQDGGGEPVISVPNVSGTGTTVLVERFGTFSTVSPVISNATTDQVVAKYYDYPGGGFEHWYISRGLLISSPYVQSTGPIVTPGYTVATLPSIGIGGRAFVTDATSCSLNGALTGGGSIKCPVWYNGAAWVGD